MREIRIREEESGQRLDKFLRRYLPAAGTGFIYKMLRKKNILLDGKKASGSELLREGSVIRIYFSEETMHTFQNVGKPASVHSGRSISDNDIVYADESLMLINKPAGILTQKADPDDTSLNDMVQAWLFEKGYRSNEDRLFYEPGPANRLDRNTSGLVVIPLTLAAARQVSEMFRERTIHKQYLALTAGSYSGPKKQTAWCIRDTRSRKTEILFQERPGSDRIETLCEPIARERGRTLLKVTLVTGKTHQIRAHLQACGFPLIGDPKYGSYISGQTSGVRTSPETKPFTGLKRQFLHAWQMEFPSCGGALKGVSEHVFTAPLPADLEKELTAGGIRLPENDPHCPEMNILRKRIISE